MAKVPTAVEAGFGQVQSAPDTTPFESVQVPQGAFGQDQAANQQAAGKGLLQLADFADQVSLVNDQNAVSVAMQKARALSDERLNESTYSQTHSAMFADGKGPKDAFQGATKILGDVNREISTTLSGSRQQAMFNSAWTKYHATESRRASTHIASQFRSYTGEVEKLEKTSTETEIGNFASQAASADWRNTQQYENQAKLTINLHAETGLNETDQIELERSLPTYMASSAVRGWHSTQENLLSASQQLATGKLEDSLAQEYWDKLDPNQKKALRNDLISQGDQLIRSQNNQRKIVNDALQLQADTAIGTFWSSDQPGQESARQENYEKNIKNNVHIPLAQRNAAREALYGGEVTTDDQEGLIRLEAAIYSGDVKSISEAAAYRFDGKPVATAETMRTRIYPAVEAAQDKTFRDAMAIGLAQMGITDTLAETDVVRLQRAASFKAQMLKWRNTPEGKSGDPIAQAEIITTQIKADIKVDPGTMAMLKQMKGSYDLSNYPREYCCCCQFIEIYARIDDYVTSYIRGYQVDERFRRQLYREPCCSKYE